MNDIDLTFEQNVFDVSQRPKEPQIRHHNKPTISGDESKRLNGMSGLRRLGIKASYPRLPARLSGTVSLTRPLVFFFCESRIALSS